MGKEKFFFLEVSRSIFRKYTLIWEIDKSWKINKSWKIAIGWKINKRFSPNIIMKIDKNASGYSRSDDSLVENIK